MKSLHNVSPEKAASLFAHRMNIERYEKLLKSYLTDHERAFVQRRLEEERQLLLNLQDKPSTPSLSARLQSESNPTLKVQKVKR